MPLDRSVAFFYLVYLGLVILAPVLSSFASNTHVDMDIQVRLYHSGADAPKQHRQKTSKPLIHLFHGFSRLCVVMRHSFCSHRAIYRADLLLLLTWRAAEAATRLWKKQQCKNRVELNSIEIF